MSTATRRHILMGLCAAASAGFIPLGRMGWAAVGPGTAEKRLVVIMLRGAVDGLNVVVPYGDPGYAAARPTIALQPPGGDRGVIDLDGRFGLHPALAPLMPLWQSGRLAFVHACGSPDPSRSHFDAQNFMESGTPGVATTPDGWMNRLLGVLPSRPDVAANASTRAISLGLTQPKILIGARPTTNFPLGPKVEKPLPVDRPVLAAAFAKLYAGNDAMGQVFRQGLEARQELMADMQDEQMMADNGAPAPAGFPGAAQRLARLLATDKRIQLAFVDLGGWDTHVNEGADKGQLANHLMPLGQGLAALAQGLGPELDDTVVLVMSEFGRTVHENGNGGTDHGHGNVLWAFGGKVAGGRMHGSWPGLDTGALYQGRDLAVTSDFRTVVGLVLERHLGIGNSQLQMVLPQAPAADRSLVSLLDA